MFFSGYPFRCNDPMPRCDRYRVHWIVFHHDVHLVWHDVLLRLWFLVGGGVVAVHHVGRNVHHLDLLSIVRRGLQLVVALLLCQWVVRGVCVFVFLLLFRHSKVSRFSGSLLSFCLVVFCRDGWYLHWFELFLTHFFPPFFLFVPPLEPLATPQWNGQRGVDGGVLWLLVLVGRGLVHHVRCRGFHSDVHLCPNHLCRDQSGLKLLFNCGSSVLVWRTYRYARRWRIKRLRDWFGV